MWACSAQGRNRGSCAGYTATGIAWSWCRGMYSSFRCTCVGSHTKNSWCFYLEGLLYLLRQLTLLLIKTQSLGLLPKCKHRLPPWKFPCSWGSSWLSQGRREPSGFLRSASPSVPGQMKCQKAALVFFVVAACAAAIHHTQLAAELLSGSSGGDRL